MIHEQDIACKFNFSSILCSISAKTLGFFIYIGVDFIHDEGADLQEEEVRQRMHRRPFLPRDEQDEQDVEDLEKYIHQRYGAKQDYSEYDEETTDVEQQALLPSVKDPKLWMVTCKVL